MQTVLAARGISSNAKIGSVAMAAAAFLTLLLSHFSPPLAPLRLVALAIATFAAWAFCDEMGTRKPLNRAGLVAFAIAAVAKVQLAVGVAPEHVGRYYVLYASFLLAAVLFWSVAFLHRQRALKIVGAVGVFLSAAPIVALVVGHVVLGVGAFLGVGALVSGSQSLQQSDLGFVTLIERIFGLWAYVAAWLLWRGHIRAVTPA